MPSVSIAAGCAAGRSRMRHAALTAKVAASTATASPVPLMAMSTPASAGPATLAMLRVSEISALASCRRAEPTVCGIRPISAGMNSAAAVP